MPDAPPPTRQCLPVYTGTSATVYRSPSDEPSLSAMGSPGSRARKALWDIETLGTALHAP
jgi:hypothetical protein